MAQGQIFVISAPSGAGKSTVSKALLERMDDLGLSISHTTRDPRPGEQDGVHYHFTDNTTFDRMVEEDAFVEWAHVYTHRSGTSVTALEQASQQGQDVLLELNPEGSKNIKKLYPHATLIFILPPSLRSLAERLQKRSQDHIDTIRYRLRKAKDDISEYHHFDYLVVNRDIEETIEACKQIIQTQRLTSNQKFHKNRELISELLEEPIPEI